VGYVSLHYLLLVCLIHDLFFIGYKQREKISKALKTRSQAILTALERYNKAALGLNPPADTLLWEDIVKMATLADFDLLRLSHTDIRTLPWAQPAAREAMALHFGIKRAVEEIDRLNVEIRHLVTYMLNELTHVASIADDLKGIDGPLSSYLTRQLDYNRFVFQDITYYLQKTSQLIGFSGSLSPGTPVDEALIPQKTTTYQPRWVEASMQESLGVDGLLEGKDEPTEPTLLDAQTDAIIDLVETFARLE
jgi:hypothetical protein